MHFCVLKNWNICRLKNFPKMLCILKFSLWGTVHNLWEQCISPVSKAKWCTLLITNTTFSTNEGVVPSSSLSEQSYLFVRIIPASNFIASAMSPANTTWNIISLIHPVYVSSRQFPRALRFIISSKLITFSITGQWNLFKCPKVNTQPLNPTRELETTLFFIIRTLLGSWTWLYFFIEDRDVINIMYNVNQNGEVPENLFWWN